MCKLGHPSKASSARILQVGAHLLTLMRAPTCLAVMSWAMDAKCGGITWMYPDVDPRKNVRCPSRQLLTLAQRERQHPHSVRSPQAITTLEAIQASAKVSMALKHVEPLRAAVFERRARALWAFFKDVGLLGKSGLVHDNVTGSTSAFHCCNATHAPVCDARDTITWTYNQVPSR